MNMQTIEVDDEVFQFLQRQAVPLVDTPNSVLRRLLLGNRGKRGGVRVMQEPDLRLMSTPTAERPSKGESRGTYGYMEAVRSSPAGLRSSRGEPPSSPAEPQSLPAGPPSRRVVPESSSWYPRSGTSGRSVWRSSRPWHPASSSSR